jgi:hypothetical protein
MAVYPGGAPWSGETELATEMGVNDIIGLVNFTAGEFRKQKYSVFNSFFLKTNADRTVNANLTFKDGKKAKFGDDGDLEIYHADPDSFIKNTKVDGHLKIQATTSGPTVRTIMDIDPDIGTNGSIAFDSTFLNRDNTVNEGIQFQSTDSRVKFFSNAMFQGTYLNYDGAAEGLSFNSSNELVVNKKLRQNANIDLASFYISGNGGDVGLSFGGGANANFSGTITSSGRMVSDSEFRGYALLIEDPVSGSVPTLAGYGTLFIESASGDLKFRFASGTLKTIATDP